MALESRKAAHPVSFKCQLAVESEKGSSESFFSIKQGRGIEPRDGRETVETERKP